MKKNENKILIVDEKAIIREMMKKTLIYEGYSVFDADNVQNALYILKNNDINLMLTDINFPDFKGIDLIQYVKEHFPKTDIIVVTGYPTIENAVQSVKKGAAEYITKPFTTAELITAVQKAYEKQKENRLKEKNKTYRLYKGLIGESRIMKEVFKITEKAAKSNANVLITGESGTGKELIARAIHYNSNRSAAPFIAVNCGAIPEELLESELFGHIKGAFTNAFESRTGFFKAADKGTIFLDEVSNTSPGMQAKLLRTIQNKEISMVGSSKTELVDVRILTATNKSLKKLCENNLFREDLYYRLNVVPIELPPLKERENDIIILTDYFLEMYSKKSGIKKPEIEDNVISIFKKYTWPGNVRELENLIQRLIIMHERGIIKTSDLPVQMKTDFKSDDFCICSLEEIEKKHILNILNHTNGNKSKASKILGITRKTLHGKIKKYSISV